jgi:hypothetical protein
LNEWKKTQLPGTSKQANIFQTWLLTPNNKEFDLKTHFFRSNSDLAFLQCNSSSNIASFFHFTLKKTSPPAGATTFSITTLSITTLSILGYLWHSA